MDVYPLTDCFCQLNIGKDVKGIDHNIIIVIIVFVFVLLGNIVVRAIHMFLTWKVIH